MTHSPAPVSFRARRLRAGSALAIGALALIVLAGCTAGPTPAPSASPTSTPSVAPTAGTAPSQSPSPTPTPTAAADTAVTLGCDGVLTPDDVYNFNPNFGTAPNYNAKGGSAAEVAAAHKGVACGWSNQTSGDLIEASVAQPSPATLADLKSQAEKASTSVTTYGAGVKGYFGTSGGVGQAQVFTGAYWVAVTSVEFVEARDAELLVAAVVSHLP